MGDISHRLSIHERLDEFDKFHNKFVVFKIFSIKKTGKREQIGEKNMTKNLSDFKKGAKNMFFRKYIFELK